MKICSKGPETKRFMRARQLVCLLMCLLLTAAVLPAGGTQAETDGKVVRVGWYESAFNTTDGFGRRSGYAYEYQMKIAAYNGWNYEYVEGSWPELLQMLIRGEIDMMSDVSYTPERAESMLFPSLPMGTEEYYLFVAEDNTEITAADFRTLNGKKVGVNQGSVQEGFYQDWEEIHGVESEIVEVTCGEDESLKMLEKGELDAYITVDSFTAGILNESGKPTPICKIGSSDYFFAVAKGRQDLLDDLEIALGRIQEENRHYNHELFEKHFITRGANAFLTTTEKEWLENHGTIRVGYQDGYLAFCATDPETGKLTGALKDYLEDASSSLKNAHFQFETRAYPTAEDAMEALRRGEVDCMFPANLSVGDGEESGLFMTPPLMETDLFAVVRETDRNLFSDREYVVVAVNRGNPNYESILKDHFPNWRIVYYPTTAECLQAVSKNVADCVLISSYRYSNIARQCEREGLATVSIGTEIDYCFGVAAGQTELYSILSKAAELVPDSEVHSALSHYIAEDSRTTLQDLIRENSWVVIATIAFAALVILALLLQSKKSEQKTEQLISATETDDLTGLYNRDYFLQYAGHMCQEHPDRPMDAIVLNIDRFHSVNALNGRDFGDRILRALGSEIQESLLETGGIAGRFEADQFDIFCSHREEYQTLYNRFQTRLEETAQSSGIRLRMGVMPWKKDMEAIQMFDKARTACAMVKDNFKEHLIIFDQKMQERETFEQHLLNDLQRALNSYQFEVHYQPQYDIRFDPPKIVSAEALIRWRHPELGMISPADFIPLFEGNGQIRIVDNFVWAEAAHQIAEWKEKYDFTIPVSVNLSRVDVFDPHTVRSSMGSIFSLNIHMYADFDAYRAEYPEHTLFPFMLDASVPLSDVMEHELPSPFALIFGNEGSGLPHEFASMGQAVRIESNEKIDSLNLSIAAAIGMYAFSGKAGLR